MADQKTTILDLIRVHEDFVNPLFVCPCGGSFLILLSTAVRLADHASADIEMDFECPDCNKQLRFAVVNHAGRVVLEVTPHDEEPG